MGRRCAAVAGFAVALSLPLHALRSIASWRRRCCTAGMAMAGADVIFVAIATSQPKKIGPFWNQKCFRLEKSPRSRHPAGDCDILHERRGYREKLPTTTAWVCPETVAAAAPAADATSWFQPFTAVSWSNIKFPACFQRGYDKPSECDQCINAAALDGAQCRRLLTCDSQGQAETVTANPLSSRASCLRLALDTPVHGDARCCAAKATGDTRAQAH